MAHIGLLASALFVLAAGLAGLAVPDRVGGSVDFAEYGGAARALAAGENPYDPTTLLKYQTPAGWEGTSPPRDDGRPPTPNAQMMWNPPWALPLVLPLAYLPWGAGFLAWDALQLTLIAWASVAIWRLAGGAASRWWLPALLALAFAPTLYLLRLGQCSGFLLAGVAGFAHFLARGRPVPAGLCLALTAAKPHLLLPWAALVALDALVRPATRRAVAIGCVVLGAAALTPMVWRPNVWPEYAASYRAPTDELHVSPADWDPPIVAARLSVWAADVLKVPPAEALWVQFVPSIVATAGLAAYWWRKRRAWDWGRETPGVLLAAFLATAYGAWGFDLVVLLAAVAAMAARLSLVGGRPAFWGAGAYLAFNAALLTGRVPVIWWTPLLAAGYAGLAWASRR